MVFRELLSAVETLAAGGELDVRVAGIAYDSRRVKPGYVFVAIEGFQADGHDFVSEAVAKGAAAVVLKRPLRLAPGIAWARVDDTRLALALLAGRFYGAPSRKLKLVGVTGTNGKTTTTNLIAAILESAGNKTGLIGTIHNRIGGRVLPVGHTTPESLDLQFLLAQMVDEGVQAAVMEVSSHALALHRVAGCDFDVAVFTNLTQDHLDFHRDMEDYLAAKCGLFSGVPCHDPKTGKKYAVINIDDPAAERFLDASGGRAVLTYAVGRPADVRGADISVTGRGVSFTALSRWGDCRLNLKLTGLFNVYNALAAFAAGIALGVPVDAVKAALEKVPGVPGRFELIDRGQDFALVVDYAHTPDGLENILKTARQIAGGKLVTVFGCGGDRDRTKRPRMGAIAARYSDYTIITSDNPRTEDPLAIIAEIETGLKAVAGREKYAIEPDRRRAIRMAVQNAGAGDVVVIAGKGHEDYQIIGTEKFPFDDRLEAARALEETGYKEGRG
ncbi:MAG: UDP-N-acetylmuramoyl-L-alanyl-D-glutamate--2,6-diaminopimelate ligase [Peptococcaceae bacterium]|nr:UDP-N-acetylmuramoyl-L-alanyl-D-glutamate--2,6-diaminopimelate ligase [Peptococcaceae bacterium]